MRAHSCCNRLTAMRINMAASCASCCGMGDPWACSWWKRGWRGGGRGDGSRGVSGAALGAEQMGVEDHYGQARQLFADQFEAEGDHYLYRKSMKGRAHQGQCCGARQIY